MSSEASAQTGAPAAAPAAAAGGSSMTMIIAAIVVVVVVIAALGYFLVLKDDGDLELEGQWTVSGGTMKSTMVLNNDTASKMWLNSTIPANTTEIIDFDDQTTMPDGWDINDLGGGDFEIENFEMDDANFGTVTGHYEIDGDTMTISMSGSGHVIDGTDYMAITFEYSMNLARA